MTTSLHELLTRARSRIRHDHDYPMGELHSVSPHHCAGCDVERDIDAALATGGYRSTEEGE